MTLREALKVLERESIGDFIYAIRDRVASDTSFAGNTWEHPRVVAYGEACATIKKFIDDREEATWGEDAWRELLTTDDARSAYHNDPLFHRLMTMVRVRRSALSLVGYLLAHALKHHGSALRKQLESAPLPESGHLRHHGNAHRLLLELDEAIDPSPDGPEEAHPR